MAIRHRSTNTGFTLIEILVALVVLLVGLMGAAGLMVRTVQQEAESYQRLQALNVLQDMVDRINANRAVADCYSYGAAGSTMGHNVSALTSCSLGDASQQAIANADLTEWNNLLQGAAEQIGSAKVGAMVGARGCVQQISAADQTYRITVAWQGLSETVTATENNTCGKDQYGDEKLRRIVSAIIRIGDLS
ncbi:type IV pilus modification protein PilV [uncultured Zhongshania sp.]|uniref:type IV pilus modification protein PilV n=1 Tax=uncultured Zhongshania sp. TaxID=1642288 RepID=UPI0025DA35E4|nr:type IV pilus modification protein PilV [uncultured Zhongshania sp.]